jgi:hypothetical protein
MISGVLGTETRDSQVFVIAVKRAIELGFGVNFPATRSGLTQEVLGLAFPVIFLSFS